MELLFRKIIYEDKEEIVDLFLETYRKEPWYKNTTDKYTVSLEENMKKLKILSLSFCLEVLLILAVFTANLFPNLYFLFYNGIYGIVFSMLVPILFLCKKKENLQTVGFNRLYLKQWIILICFVIFSTGGRIIPLVLGGAKIQWELIRICLFPLIMTTFFEEFLIRGFLQTRIEKQLGFIVAILVSGFLFSIYHIGYPGYRNFDSLFLLFIVGIGFATAFKLSGNNFYVAYFVNLPNAFVTYILNSDRFPMLTIRAVIGAIITIIFIIVILIIFNKKTKGIRHNGT
jgi:membrane protease YdiL (CAAX protease family)